jgi:transcription elongation factor
MHVCYAREGIPTVEELEAFLGCEALLLQTVAKTRRRIEQTQLAPNDRVKFITGTFRGLLGKVVSLCGVEVDIYLPSHDIIQRVELSEVVKHFKVGDRVKVRAGRDEVEAGVFKLGWVTKVEASEVTVLDTADGSEVSKTLVSKSCH